MSVIQYYGLSYNNPDRKQRLRDRFQKENIDITITDGVAHTDSRIACAPEGAYGPWSCMWGHLDMLKLFLASDAHFGVFCEDDILLRKGFGKRIPEFIFAYERMGLEILLLGYLLKIKPVTISETMLPLVEQPVSYMRYPGTLWGSQMYMLNRKTAEKFLNKYSLEYAMSTLTDTQLTPFSADWTLTKDGNRALVYPLFALEEGTTPTTHTIQSAFHKSCYDAHFDKELYY